MTFGMDRTDVPSLGASSAEVRFGLSKEDGGARWRYTYFHGPSEHASRRCSSNLDVELGSWRGESIREPCLLLFAQTSRR